MGYKWKTVIYLVARLTKSLITVFTYGTLRWLKTFILRRRSCQLGDNYLEICLNNVVVYTLYTVSVLYCANLHKRAQFPGILAVSFLPKLILNKSQEQNIYSCVKC